MFGASLSTEEGVTFFSRSMAPGPLSWCWTLWMGKSVSHCGFALARRRVTYMWLTSKRLAFSRVHMWLSTWLRSAYCKGISNPAKGTILAPCSTCKSYSCVLLRGSLELDAYRTAWLAAREATAATGALVLNDRRTVGRTIAAEESSRRSTVEPIEARGRLRVAALATARSAPRVRIRTLDMVNQCWRN